MQNKNQTLKNKMYENETKNGCKMIKPRAAREISAESSCVGPR